MSGGPGSIHGLRGPRGIRGPPGCRGMTGPTGPSSECACPEDTQTAGRGVPHNVMQPSIVATYIISLGGTIPGEIKMIAHNNVPEGWMKCDGRKMLVEEHKLLFSMIGHMYTDGTGNSDVFNIPDLRGRVIVGAGHGNGLSDRCIGEELGEELHSLCTSELATHSHVM